MQTQFHNIKCTIRRVEDPVHYGFCPLVKFTDKDLAKLTALADIFKIKSYFR